MNSDGRIPAHDLDTEAALLSMVMIDPKAIATVRDAVSPEDFFSEAHRRIFEGALAVHARGDESNIVHIAGWLKQHGRIEQVGMPYLTEVLNAAPSLSRIDSYASRVKELASVRRLVLLCQRTAMRGYLGHDEVENLRDLFDEHERELREISGGSSVGISLRPIGEAIRSSFAKLVEHMKSGNATRGRPTGFIDYDRATGGLHGGDVTILAGRPRMGKTSVAMNIATNVSRTGDASVVFSLEMPSEQLADRVVCSDARVDLRGLRTRLSEQSWSSLTKSAVEITQLPIFVDERSRTVAEMKMAVRWLKADLERKGKKLGLVVIDYLGLMRIPKAERHDIAIGMITSEFKAMAKEFDVPILVLCQLNRKCEERTNHRPIISDLKDSGNIEQDADNIVFVYRDEIYNESTKEPGIAELIIAKQRNGPECTVKVAFEGRTTTFSNLAHGYQHDYEAAQ